MEKYDVAIVGGGSAGLAALMELAKRGITAVLFETGSEIGAKSVTGGILYSKRYRGKRVYNVEDVFGGYPSEAPVERLIEKYYLVALSRDKSYSVDLTDMHWHNTAFAYTVLMSKINKWFAQVAEEEAIKFGGGIVCGTYVRDIRWENGKTIVETDKYEPVEVKAVIAADGVNSEIAVKTGARRKFSERQLFQGVKVVVALPEDVIDERFGLRDGRGAAYLFAGDVSRGHLGGGFLYTNRSSLSIGTVYYFDSLLQDPHEPYELLNDLLRNPLVKSLMRNDEVPALAEEASKEEQIMRLNVNRWLKAWEELRYATRADRERLVASGKFRSEEEIHKRMQELRRRLEEEFKVRFETNYVELEYSAKLVPYGLTAAMAKPYHRNVLFVGDAAGRGVFVGPRIEGINIGIDDAARAAEAINAYLLHGEQGNLGEYYASLIRKSPYTAELRSVEAEFLRVLIGSGREALKGLRGLHYKAAYGLLAAGSVQRGLSKGAAALSRLFSLRLFSPLLKSKFLYVRMPITIAESLGSRVEPDHDYGPRIPSVAERVGRLRFDEDPEPHIKILEKGSAFIRKMEKLCPTYCYTLETVDKKRGLVEVVLNHEGCVECGTCAKETFWTHTRGGRGVEYLYG